jgi:predicted DNA-binding transcriptional regulator AlpA
MENSKKPSSKSDDQLLRIQDVAAITTLSKSCINLWVAQGRFPKPIVLSKTVKLWSMGVLRQWMFDQQLIRGHSNV